MTIAQAIPSPRPLEGHDTLVVTITPTGAQAYGQCPLHFAEVFQKQPPHLANRAIERGKYLHALVHRYNRALIDGDGSPLGLDEVIARVAVPRAFSDGADDETAAITYAREQLYGYTAWLDEADFAAILGAEQYVRTPARRVTGVEGTAVVFSGRIDLVALGRDNRLVLADVKASSVLAPDALQVAPSAFVYRHLGVWAYGNDDIDIVQVVPATGQTSRAHLIVDNIEAGTALCRAMVASIAAQSFPPSPGEYCAYCAYAPECPAFAGGANLATGAF